jgi:ribosome biogenesis GTPase A
MRVKYSFSSRRTGNIENIAKQRTPFPKVVRDMIRICDIILEVLDARFIDDTRNLAMEELVKLNNKKLIYVFNKADLVKIPEIKEQAMAKGIHPFVFVSSKARIGSKELRTRIKIEVKKMNIPHSQAHVGIIGYPNTGKSSLINFLTGRSSAKTASEAGFTHGLQKIRLTSGILLLDTPGVIPDQDYSTTKGQTIAKHAKIGVRTHDKVKDPDFIVSSLMENYSKQIETFYNIRAEGNAEKLIEEIGKRKKLLKKGGIVDMDRAARVILKDWQEGIIRV